MCLALHEHRRPTVEYIRDVYAELMAMGEGARRPGDRSDISSDEEDELEVSPCARNLVRAHVLRITIFPRTFSIQGRVAHFISHETVGL